MNLFCFFKKKVKSQHIYYLWITEWIVTHFLNLFISFDLFMAVLYVSGWIVRAVRKTELYIIVSHKMVIIPTMVSMTLLLRHQYKMSVTVFHLFSLWQPVNKRNWNLWVWNSSVTEPESRSCSESQDSPFFSARKTIVFLLLVSVLITLSNQSSPPTQVTLKCNTAF